MDPHLPANHPPGEITELLHAVRSGDGEAASKLIPLVYSHMRRLAASFLRRERPDHTLQPTALVNDVLLQILKTDSIDWKDRAHFFAITATLMRRMLISHARAHQALKRGSAQTKLSLDLALVIEHEQFPQLLMLDNALSKLQQLDPRQERIVELRFFAGMAEDEIAEVIGVSIRTVRREWRMARAWLYSEMTK